MLDSTDITAMLVRARQGDDAASDQLFPAVYDHLRRIAGGQFRRQKPDQTLQATALVHEAYLKLVNQTAEWRDRAHFFAVAARAMRHILIDHARARAAEKRGHGRERVSLEQVEALTSDVTAPNQHDTLSVLALDEALSALGEVAPRQAQVVELRFFAGLSVDQIAECIGVSPRTVDLDWKLARAWLAKALSESDTT